MKSFKEFLEESKLEESKLENIKQGTKVKIKNAKSYDALAKSNVVDGVFDRVYKHSKGNFAMVKVGTGQSIVDFKDLVLNESKDFDILSENLDASKAFSNIKSDLISIERKLSSVGFQSKDRDIKKKCKELEDKLTKIRREIHDLI